MIFDFLTGFIKREIQISDVNFYEFHNIASVITPRHFLSFSHVLNVLNIMGEWILRTLRHLPW